MTMQTEINIASHRYAPQSSGISTTRSRNYSLSNEIIPHEIISLSQFSPGWGRRVGRAGAWGMGAVIQVWPDIFKVITKVLTLAVSQNSAMFDKHLSNMSQFILKMKRSQLHSFHPNHILSYNINL